MNVFHAFKESDKPYTFLTIVKGARGNQISDEATFNGILKRRKGVTTANGIQTTDSTTTMHVRPSDYPEGFKFEGHGIRKDGVEYQIVGSSEGRNFQNNRLEHYTLNLEMAEFSKGSS